MRLLVLLCFFTAFLLACGGAESAGTNNQESTNPGKAAYLKNCTMCHGEDGKLNAMNAKDLTTSTLSPELTEQAIAKGSPDKGMPPYANRLTADELKAVVEYVMQLRK